MLLCFNSSSTQRCALQIPGLTSMCWLCGYCSARVQQLIPDDYEYSSVNGDAFVSTDATSQIKEGTEVRIKIVGVRADPHDMVRAGWWLMAPQSTAHTGWCMCVLIPWSRRCCCCCPVFCLVLLPCAAAVLHRDHEGRLAGRARRLMCVWLATLLRLDLCSSPLLQSWGQRGVVQDRLHRKENNRITRIDVLHFPQLLLLIGTIRSKNSRSQPTRRFMSFSST